MKNIYILPAYVGIILVKGNEILLVKRHNTDWMQDHWNFPGGLLEQHETLINAAAREAKEEIGVITSPDSLELVHVIHVKKSKQNTKDILGFYFMTQNWQGTPINNEPHRHSEIGWFDMKSLPSNITQHALQALDGFKKNIRYSEN